MMAGSASSTAAPTIGVETPTVGQRPNDSNAYDIDDWEMTDKESFLQENTALPKDVVKVKCEETLEKVREEKEHLSKKGKRDKDG